MTVNVYFSCPKCDYENSTEYDIGEHFADLEGYECDECGHKLTNKELLKIYSELEGQAMGKAIDQATDRDR